MDRSGTTRHSRAASQPRGSAAHPVRSGAAGPLVGVLAASVLVLAGCGADVERDGAARAADAFTASATTDPGAACAVLAPRTLEALEDDGPCPEALSATGLPEAGDRRGVTVAGHSAQVRYAGDTVFLSLFADGWRVTAAGCSRTSLDDAVPYDCSVDGG